MFSATYFTYDGEYSGNYGLMIADFNNNPVIETATFSPVLNTYKPSITHRFFNNGIMFEAPPQHQFSIISETPIPDFLRRKILSWLVARDSFKKLIIHQPDLQDYYYKCIFTDTSLIFVNGQCHGFRLTANFDSVYQYGIPNELVVTGDGSVKSEVIINDSDIIDDYVYPTVKFSSLSGGIDIINKTDAQRTFSFSGLQPNEEIMVDNELKYIKSSLEKERLSSFNKNWLRLKKGINRLEIKINGQVTITCPTYAMMGF